jgi:peroxiredoxin Q/BCP
MFKNAISYLIKLFEKYMNKGTTHLKEGDKAPDFITKNEMGKEVKLSDYLGKKVILYFYPKDDTTGCTKESCNLRDNYQLLRNKGFIVLGISNDDEKSHQKFIKKYSLPFNLLADTNKDVVNKYGVFGPKQMFGKDFDGIYRTTFIIDEQGIIEKIIKEVDTENHTNQILPISRI